jgi:anti-sigma regulatory factor (Ser/Thr protein kinase)
MPTVEVSFTPLPAHVRTARLVALAVARRAGVADDLLDEVRLAVGEACSRAVGVHAGSNLSRPITMRLSDDVDVFTVAVHDVGVLDQAATITDLDSRLDTEAVAEPSQPDDSSDTLGADTLGPEFGLAVISGLVEDVAVDTDGEGTSVTMRWPAAHPLSQREP